MKKRYHVSIMSIDPQGDIEDNHQRYGFTIEADNETEAKELGENRLLEEIGFDAPIFWVKCFEIA